MKTIYNTQIQPGENKVVKIPIGSLPTGTPIKIPVYVFNGKEDGPTVLIQGGLHGDEINGVEICKRLLVGDYFTNLNKGCVVLIPLFNVYGFIHFSRELPDGKDINRSYPGSKYGSLASRMAYCSTHDILPHIDFGIDFHTGGDMRSNYPQIRYSPEDKISKELATIFNAPFQFESGLIKKSFRAAAAKQNIPILVFEGGESMRFNEFAIHEGINGVLRIMAHYKLIADSVLNNIPQNKTVTLTNRKWVRAKKGGIFTPYVNNGSPIEKGQVIGFITDAYGNRNLVVKAPFDGYIVCVNNHPLVSQGDAIFHIGKKDDL